MIHKIITMQTEEAAYLQMWRIWSDSQKNKNYVYKYHIRMLQLMQTEKNACLVIGGVSILDIVHIQI